MEKGVLNEVVAAEKEVQHCIELEQQRLHEWIEREKHDAALAVAREEQNDVAAREQELAEAKKGAEARALQVTDEAETLAQRLEMLDDRTLTGIVMKWLPKILLE